MRRDLSQLSQIDDKSEVFRSGVKKHFERTMNLLEGEGEAKLVTSTKNFKCSEEEGFGIYVDHASKNQYKVDYSSRKLIEVTPLTEELNSKSQELVDVIGMGLKKYLEEFFSKNSHLYGTKRSFFSLLQWRYAQFRLHSEDSKR